MRTAAGVLFVVFLGCQKPDLIAVGESVRCGMTRREAETVARKYGLSECAEPALKKGAPDSSCHSKSRGVAFWFDEKGLTAYQTWDSEAEDCPDPTQESGCASEVNVLCGATPTTGSS